MSDFLQMGGYAVFVWGSYGLAAVVLVFNVISARKKLRMTMEKMTMRARQKNQTTNAAGASEI